MLCQVTLLLAVFLCVSSSWTCGVKPRLRTMCKLAGDDVAF